MGKFVDLCGQRFGSWVVLHRADKSRAGRVQWFCRCDCGHATAVQACNLVNGVSRCCRRCGGAKISRRKYRGVGGLSGTYYGNVKRSAQHRGIAFSLSKEYLWDLFVAQQGRCALTGREISLGSLEEQRRNGPATASVDRIDSSQAYIEGNVQWVHKDVNTIKWDLPQAEFIRLCREVVEYQQCN